MRELISKIAYLVGDDQEYRRPCNRTIGLVCSSTSEKAVDSSAAQDYRRGVTPIEDALVHACESAGIQTADRHLLHEHSNSVWLVDAGVVARVNRRDHRGLRARESVELTRWLVEQGVPVTEPARNEAISVGDHVVTFWHHYPQSGTAAPPAAALGTILAQVHALPRPPIELPAYAPLVGLVDALASPAGAALPDSDRVWLEHAAAEVIDAYHRLDSQLGEGFVHGDAYPGNTLWGPGGAVLLGDWDEAAVAPRELDLVNTIQSGSRFGTGGVEDFVAAYGVDVRAWSGFAVLHRMRDLHTLGAYIRRAGGGHRAAGDELGHRLRTLRDPARSGELWHVIT